MLSERISRIKKEVECTVVKIEEAVEDIGKVVAKVEERARKVGERERVGTLFNYDQNYESLDLYYLITSWGTQLPMGKM